VAYYSCSIDISKPYFDIVMALCLLFFIQRQLYIILVAVYRFSMRLHG